MGVCKGWPSRGVGGERPSDPVVLLEDVNCSCLWKGRSVNRSELQHSLKLGYTAGDVLAAAESILGRFASFCACVPFADVFFLLNWKILYFDSTTAN